MSETIYKCPDCGHIGEGEEHLDSIEGEYGSCRCSEVFIDRYTCKACGAELDDADEYDEEKEFDIEYERLIEAGDVQGLRELLHYERATTAFCGNCIKFGKCVIAGEFGREGYCYDYARR